MSYFIFAIRWPLLILLIILGILCFMYRLNNPEKTETELFLDIFNGKIFKLENYDIPR